LEKFTNQARFVDMIIKKELAVSGRKKLDIVRDLKSKKFKSFPKVSKAVAAGETEEVVEEEEEVEDLSDGGYDYLLSVYLYDIPADLIDAHLVIDGGEGEVVA
jgi:DNA topoisomerase-2